MYVYIYYRLILSLNPVAAPLGSHQAVLETATKFQAIWRGETWRNHPFLWLCCGESGEFKPTYGILR